MISDTQLVLNNLNQQQQQQQKQKQQQQPIKNQSHHSVETTSILQPFGSSQPAHPNSQPHYYSHSQQPITTTQQTHSLDIPTPPPAHDHDHQPVPPEEQPLLTELYQFRKSLQHLRKESHNAITLADVDVKASELAEVKIYAKKKKKKKKKHCAALIPPSGPSLIN
jgi:hypothetical protein